ncbi:MAG: hypothetical protein IJT96_08680 [Lachnospiraceae bacterium]|nr:hypothetical protein [Lachnospiraceae bacterium]
MNECPECGRMTLEEDSNGYVCISCGEHFERSEMEKCENCGSMYRKKDQPDVPEMCPRCYENKLNED